MKGSNKKTGNSLLIVLLLIFLAVALGAFWYFNFARMGTKLPANYSRIEFKIINKAAINEIKALKACGNWPVTAVNLSIERGNPFVRKISEASLMAATPAAECLPVSQ